MANPVVAAAAAEELLKPETVEEEKGVDEGGEDGDDDELEALRLAALNSIRPKKKAEAPPTTGFELKKHPVRNNLVAIVIPSEEDQVPTHSCTSQSSSYLSFTYLLLYQVISLFSQAKEQNKSPRDEVKKASAEDDEVDLSDSEYEEYSEYVTDSQVSASLFMAFHSNGHTGSHGQIWRAR